MRLPFYKLSPGGNPTLLFPLTLPKEQRSAVAGICLSPLHLHAEQAGFVHPHKAELTMAGDEFCLNATRCMALVLALEERLPVTHSDDQGQPCGWEGPARVSGLAEPVLLRVCRKDNAYFCAVSLSLFPLPVLHNLAPGLTLVCLSGITHLLVDALVHPFASARWAEDAALLRARFELEDEAAVGCVWWSALPSPQQCSPTREDCCQVQHIQAHPVVRVREPYSLYYESSCGSGALALALALHAQHGATHFCIQQPSGTPLSVLLHGEEQTMQAEVDGPVSLTAQGMTLVDMPAQDTVLTSRAE